MLRSTRAMRIAGLAGAAIACGVLGGCSGCHIEIPADAWEDLASVTNVPPELTNLQFICGTWRMLDKDGLSEEIWSAPHGTSMSGVFRMINPDGALHMQEILTISAEPDGVYMRLRHFDAALIAREEKDAPIVLKLEKSGERLAVFRKVSGSASLDTITYRREDKTLHGEVAFAPESKRETIRFEMRRMTVEVQ